MHRKEKKRENSYKNGSTLIEILVALFVFSLMALTFYSAFTVGMVRIIDAQKRLQAMTLAIEQMEKIRNLAYDDVGFEGGTPECVTHCALVPDEEKSLGNGIFFIGTSIQYRDDPDDGTLVGHSDVIPTDYKRVIIRVEWGNRGAEQRVEMTSRFVPPGMEKGIPNTGALSINVSDYTGAGVTDVRVEVVGVAGNFFTDETGNLFLLGIPTSTVGYPIRLSKAGYENLETMAFPPAGSFPPKNPPVVVADGAINVGNFDLNFLTDMTLEVRDPFGNALPDKEFTLVQGGRRWDNNATPTNYEFMNVTQSSDSEGKIHTTDRSGGQYVFALNDTSEYVLWKAIPPVSPETKALREFSFPYGGTGSLPVVLLNKTTPGISVRVTDETGIGVLAGATVRVTNTLGTYDETQTTDTDGYVYFPKTENAMVSGTSYTIHTEANGFISDDTTRTVSALEEVVVKMGVN